MILPINDKYRIHADKHCWSIQKPRKRKENGKVITEWISFQWYISLEQAVNNLGELMVRTSDAQTLTDALTEVKNVTTTLSRALSPQFKVIQKVDQENVV